MQNNKQVLPEEYEFWKTSEEKAQGPYNEPTKLEEIASLKDLWIVNMEKKTPSIEQQLDNRKSTGFKANALTKPSMGAGRHLQDRSLPKLHEKSGLSNIRRSADGNKFPTGNQRKSSIITKQLLQVKR